MKTIVLDEPGAFRLTATDAPGDPAAGEALVKVKRVGICGTDLHAYRGQQPFFSYPRILGHELGVEILALGPGNGPKNEGLGLSVGDICAVEPYLHCGTCQACRRGATNCCDTLQVLGVHTDGGMREAILVPAAKLLKAQNAPVDHLALVEMLCIGAHAVRRAALEVGEPVLVIGAGPIGLSVIQFAKLAGANVAVMELSTKRIAFCEEHMGIEQIHDGNGDSVARLQEIFGGDLPTTVFDATGNVNSMHSAFTYPANHAKLVFVGLVQADITFHDPEFHRKELTILSSRNAAREDFVNVIAALDRGAINIDPWITHRATADTLIADFPTWLDPDAGVVKAMLEF